jgi:hypothetical protein
VHLQAGADAWSWIEALQDFHAVLETRAAGPAAQRTLDWLGQVAEAFADLATLPFSDVDRPAWR